MPTGLVRYHNSRQFHFITFSCHRRLPLLARGEGYATFERELEAIRQRYKFVFVGYVLMPEHVHLLVSEPKNGSLATALQVLKQQTSKVLKKSGETQFWQRRYYDFNVRSEAKTAEKLKYMHRNPVRRGLVEKPEDWPWSSFCHYATGSEGQVEIESEWTARKRETCRQSTPASPIESHSSKKSLSGPPAPPISATGEDRSRAGSSCCSAPTCGATRGPTSRTNSTATAGSVLI